MNMLSLTYLEAFLFLVVILLLVFIILDRRRSLKWAENELNRVHQPTVKLSEEEEGGVQGNASRPSDTGSGR